VAKGIIKTVGGGNIKVNVKANVVFIKFGENFSESGTIMVVKGGEGFFTILTSVFSAWGSSISGDCCATKVVEGRFVVESRSNRVGRGVITGVTLLGKGGHEKGNEVKLMEVGQLVSRPVIYSDTTGVTVMELNFGMVRPRGYRVFHIVKFWEPTISSVKADFLGFRHLLLGFALFRNEFVFELKHGHC